MTEPNIFFCLPNFAGGGAEKVMSLLARKLSPAKKNISNADIIVKCPTQDNQQVPHQKQQRDAPKKRASFEPNTRPAVTCVVLSDDGPLKSQIDQHCDIINLQCRSARLAIFSLSRLFRQKRPLIVVSTLAYFNFMIVFALLMSGHRPKRLILREANIPESTLKSLPVRWIGPFLYKWLYNRADAVICNSLETMEELNTLGVELTRITLIPSPIDVSATREKAQKAISFPDFLYPSLPLFVSVGRLSQQKGMDRLIYWIAAMEFEANLLIIGMGKDRPELERLIERRGLKGYAKIIDFQHNPFPYMSLADAVLLGSRWEGLPNVALEALALGKKVLATADCGGLIEMKNLLDEEALVIAETEEMFILALNRIATLRHSCQNVKKLEQGNNQLADSKLPSKFNLDLAIAEYEMIIFGQ